MVGAASEPWPLSPVPEPQLTLQDPGPDACTHATLDVHLHLSMHRSSDNFIANRSISASLMPSLLVWIVIAERTAEYILQSCKTN